MTIEEWVEIGKERGADAVSIVNDRSISVGSIYIAGYAVECSLKGYLMARGIPFPAAGTAGHNLTALWKASGFHKRDIGGNAGCCTFFFDNWNTGLRYTTSMEPIGMTAKELVDGAKRIAGWINMQIRRTDLKRSHR